MKKLTISAEIAKLDYVLDFINDSLIAAGCDNNTMLSIDVAAEEVFVNIASYAYGGKDGDAVIETETIDDPRSIRITFKDSGIPYDPLTHKDPDTTLPADERDIGGLGILMVRKMMDKVSYEYSGGMNILTIIKSI